MRTIVAGAVIVLAVMGAAWGQTKDAGEARGEGVVNLGRLGIAQVMASSVNEGRKQDDKYYGVRNLFDGGENRIGGLNYDYWLSNADRLHIVGIRFEKPVMVASVVVELPENSGVKEIEADTDKWSLVEKKAVEGTRCVLKPKEPQEPQEKVMKIAVIFYCDVARVVKVSEIEVWGKAPKGVNLTPVKPEVVQPVKGVHEMKIERKGHTAEEKRMIGIAESTYPKREDALKAMREYDEQAKDPGDEKLWWYRNGFVRIPYAVTGEAVAYYAALTKGYRKMKWETGIKPRSKFEYIAEVEKKNDYKAGEAVYRDVWVVRMKLHFSLLYASLGGVSFGKERTVVLDGKGNVLHIEGDGETNVLVN